MYYEEGHPLALMLHWEAKKHDKRHSGRVRKSMCANIYMRVQLMTPMKM